MTGTSSLKSKYAAGAALALVLVPGLRALACEQTREPWARFIDFYIAAQQADAPKWSLWERVLYSAAWAHPGHGPAAREQARSCGESDSFLAD